MEQQIVEGAHLPSTDGESPTDTTMARAIVLATNLKSVQSRVSAAANGRNVRIVAVSKLKPVQDIRALYDVSHRHFGENYADELSQKAALLPDDIRWHFIGSLQSRHCKTVAQIPNVWCVSSVDSCQKAQRLNKARVEGYLHVHVQVNTSGEASKSGCRPGDDTVALCRFVTDQCPRLRLLGFMTIGSIARSQASATVNEDFVVLEEQRRLVAADLGRDDLELSMGMSTDFEAAIAMGSSEVRVGSTIFGDRPPKAEACIVLPNIQNGSMPEKPS